MTTLDEQARRRIEAAFDAAAARTTAPIACVVAEASADYALGPTLGAAAVAMFAPWPLLAFTELPAARIYLAQLVLFAGLLGALAFAPVRAMLASRARRRAAGYRGALVQFTRLGLAQAPERNGVLLYVSLTERYVRVIADVGLELPHDVWRNVLAEVTAALRAGDAGAALSSAAARIGDLVAPVFPAKPGVEVRNLKRFHML